MVCARNKSSLNLSPVQNRVQSRVQSKVQSKPVQSGPRFLTCPCHISCIPGSIITSERRHHFHVTAPENRYHNPFYTQPTHKKHLDIPINRANTLIHHHITTTTHTCIPRAKTRPYSSVTRLRKGRTRATCLPTSRLPTP
jgi:hypothetical protein